MGITEPSEFSFFRVCFSSVRFNMHGSARFSEYVQTVSPDFEDSLAPDCVLTTFKIACAVSLIPGQHDCWNASSRFAPIAIAQKAAQSAEAIFVLSIIKCLELASPCRIIFQRPATYQCANAPKSDFHNVL